MGGKTKSWINPLSENVTPILALRNKNRTSDSNVQHMFMPFLSAIQKEEEVTGPTVLNPDAQTFSNTNGVKTKPATQTILSRQAGDTFGNTYFK